MNLAEMAAIMGISLDQLRQMLDENDVIELKLTERKKKEAKEEEGEIIMV
ncbi:hypothetical protein J4212_04525 [Candidatus Woesearchaeota archaeon]|nr:hypothetical protein [Candidatus Woesearchaeota archaeon]